MGDSGTNPGMKSICATVPNKYPGQFVLCSTTADGTKSIFTPMDKQLEQLMEWLRLMAAQIPDADGTTAAQRLEAEGQRNEAVLQV